MIGVMLLLRGIPKSETINIDPNTKKAVITRQEEIDIGDVENLAQLELQLVKKLNKIVYQIKALKEEAKHTRELILKIRRKGVDQLNAIRDE